MKHAHLPDDPFQLRDLQLVLGTDHRTHYFQVLRDAVDPTRLFVYFGMALVEKIPDDKNDPQYRLLLARLYNAGARPSALHTAFGIDGKTLRRWGAALVSPDRRETARVLFGVKEACHQRALIRQFVQRRFPQIYPTHRREYSRLIREEIAQTFGVHVSGETLRPLFTQLRTQWATDRLQPPDPAGPSPQDAQLDAALSGDQPPARPEASAVPEVSASSAQPGAAPDRNPTPALPACHAQNNVPLQASACDLPVRAASSSCLPPRARAAVPQLVSHAGVLLFAPVLSTLREALATYPRLWPLVKLVLTCVWLGAVNLEQSKLLHRPSLKFFAGDAALHP